MSIKRVAIIGAGAGGVISGAALAALCERAGFAVVLEDVLPGNLRRAAAEIGSAHSGSTLRYAGSIEDAVRDADLVIDTVPDELESKLEILSLLDRMAPPHTLFATPTETLSIADLASCTYRPGQCFALSSGPVREGHAAHHVTLSYPPSYSPESLGRMETFLRAIGATMQSREDTRALP